MIRALWPPWVCVLFFLCKRRYIFLHIYVYITRGVLARSAARTPRCGASLGLYFVLKYSFYLCFIFYFLYIFT